MKKIIIILLTSIFILTGCNNKNITSNTPVKTVEENIVLENDDNNDNIEKIEEEENISEISKEENLLEAVEEETEFSEENTQAGNIEKFEINDENIQLIQSYYNYLTNQKFQKAIDLKYNNKHSIEQVTQWYNDTRFSEIYDVTGKGENTIEFTVDMIDSESIWYSYTVSMQKINGKLKTISSIEQKDKLNLLYNRLHTLETEAEEKKKYDRLNNYIYDFLKLDDMSSFTINNNTIEAYGHYDSIHLIHSGGKIVYDIKGNISSINLDGYRGIFREFGGEFSKNKYYICKGTQALNNCDFLTDNYIHNSAQYYGFYPYFFGGKYVLLGDGKSAINIFDKKTYNIDGINKDYIFVNNSKKNNDDLIFEKCRGYSSFDGYSSESSIGRLDLCEMFIGKLNIINQNIKFIENKNELSFKYEEHGKSTEIVHGPIEGTSNTIFLYYSLLKNQKLKEAYELSTKGVSFEKFSEWYTGIEEIELFKNDDDSYKIFNIWGLTSDENGVYNFVASIKYKDADEPEKYEVSTKIGVKNGKPVILESKSNKIK